MAELERQIGLEAASHQQAADALRQEVDELQLDVRNRDGEAEAAMAKLRECEDYLRRTQQEATTVRDECARVLLERDHWQKESQRLLKVSVDHLESVYNLPNP